MQGDGRKRKRPKRRGTGSYLEKAYLADIKDAGLPTPVREYRFHPIRQWKLDAIWHDVNLVVEIEGGTDGKSRHTSPAGYANDCEKYNALMEWGVVTGRPVTLLRFTSAQVHDGTARKTTKRLYLQLGGRIKPGGRKGDACHRKRKLTASR